MDNKGTNQKSDDYILVNMTEELVRNRVREMMKSYDVCQCNKCFSDICAIVLNKKARSCPCLRRPTSKSRQI